MLCATLHRHRIIHLVWRSDLGTEPRRDHGGDLAQELRYEDGDWRGSQGGEDAPRRALAGANGFLVELPEELPVGVLATCCPFVPLQAPSSRLSALRTAVPRTGYIDFTSCSSSDTAVFRKLLL